MIHFTTLRSNGLSKTKSMIIIDLIIAAYSLSILSTQDTPDLMKSQKYNVKEKPIQNSAVLNSSFFHGCLGTLEVKDL